MSDDDWAGLGSYELYLKAYAAALIDGQGLPAALGSHQQAAKLFAIARGCCDAKKGNYPYDREQFERLAAEACKGG